MAGEHAGQVALTGATSAVTPVRLRLRPYDSSVLENLRPDSRRLLAGVTVASGTLLAMRPEPITPARLPAYLASGQGTRTFLVTGPLSAISGLHEQFRP